MTPSSSTIATVRIPDTTTIAIIGGGPVGLVCSILLSLQGIDNVLFERQPSTSIHPKAVGLNQRTVEIFRKIGVEDEVLRQAAPPSISDRTAWYTSFGPEGREICSRYAWGGGPYKEAFEKASPCRYALLPQIRLEPILKKRAMQLNPDGIFYEYEVDGLDEDNDRAVVHFHERKKGETTPQHSLTATYVLTADGGRGIASQLDIIMKGESDIVDMVSAHFRSPLSQHRPDPNIFIHWFINPELSGSLKTGYLYHLGPYPMDPSTEEWCFACARLPHEQVHPFTEQDMLNRLRQTLNIPDLKVDLLSLSHWHVNAQVASRYRSHKGRVFLIGDTAHRVPPWGALGLNTGIQDADNLIWKVVLALKNGSADYEGLLNSYESERRRIGERIAKTGLYNMRAHALVLDEAIGLTPEKSEQDNVRAMEQYFDSTDKDEGELKRSKVEDALHTLDVEFYAHGAEVGWFYDLEYVGDYGNKTVGTGNPQICVDGNMELCTYHPSTRPGSQLPHAWLIESSSKLRKSSRELVRMDKLILLATPTTWTKFEHPMIEVIIVNPENNTMNDSHGSRAGIWVDIAASGALIVRPDNIIAYRFHNDEILRQPDLVEHISMIIRRILMLET